MYINTIKARNELQANIFTNHILMHYICVCICSKTYIRMCIKFKLSSYMPYGGKIWRGKLWWRMTINLPNLNHPNFIFQIHLAVAEAQLKLVSYIYQ